MVHDVETGEPGGEEFPAAETAIAAAAAASAACLSCGAAVVGPFCASCGQKNDDLRRSSFVLARDFLRDTFGFDSRMWRTLGLMAAKPGHVPFNYAHGRRSRYTPPVRLFLVVSFLSFLAIGFTQTLFIGVSVERKSEAQIAAEKAAIDEAIARGRIDVESDELVAIDNAVVNCPISVELRFFVKPQDLPVDVEAWRTCAASIRSSARVDIENDGADAERTAETLSQFERALAAITAAVENPAEINRDVNAWLPRVMFFMAPVLALLTALFIRGKDALLFDHLVLSLYSHAAGFAIASAAVVAAQLGAPHAGTAAAVGLGAYFLVALKRAYRRGWIKTVLSAAFIGFFYFAILTASVMTIVMNLVWRSV